MKINVVGIEPAWSSCAYKLQVWVDEYTRIHNHKYVLETLRKWFGEAEYMWGNCFLCDLKAGRANYAQTFYNQEYEKVRNLWSGLRFVGAGLKL